MAGSVFRVLTAIMLSNCNAAASCCKHHGTCKAVAYVWVERQVRGGGVGSDVRA
jgi:hypothetical protein